MTTASAARDADARLQTILKAVVVGAQAQDPSSRPGGEDDTGAAFAAAGALAPPYDPESLCLLIEHSNSLRQNVDAYATNIDGFGYRFEPAIDLEAEDARQRVADELALERGAAPGGGHLGVRRAPRTPPPRRSRRASRNSGRWPTPSARGWRRSSTSAASTTPSWTSAGARDRTSRSRANAFWEVLRDGKGDLARPGLRAVLLRTAAAPRPRRRRGDGARARVGDHRRVGRDPGGACGASCKSRARSESTSSPSAIGG